MEIEIIDPQQYFDKLKESKKEMSYEKLNSGYSHCYNLLEKSLRSGQYKAAEKLMFHMETIQKEHKLLDMGINIYMLRDTVEECIKKVEKQTVKIIELYRYEREIPDEIVEVVEKTKGIFDHFLIVFTDYTGEVEKQVVDERRKKDPIIFGIFGQGDTKSERLYFLGDWEDEYCDLTLNKLIAGFSEKPVLNYTDTPKTIDEFKAEFNKINPATLISYFFDGPTVVKPKSFLRRLLNRFLL